MLRSFTFATVTLVAGLGLPAAALAQDEATRRSWGAEARAEMARLAPLAGDWVVTEYMPQPDGSWHAAETAYRETTRYLLDGLAQRIEAPERPAQPWRLETTIQYDQNRDVFRLVALDDTWGNMDVYEGVMTGEGDLVVDDLRADTPYLGADGSRTYFRLTFSIESPDRNTLHVEASRDAGETWQPFQRIERVRFGTQ